MISGISLRSLLGFSATKMLPWLVPPWPTEEVI